MTGTAASALNAAALEPYKKENLKIAKGRDIPFAMCGQRLH